ncbi:MAG TPA: hydrogenase maturation nickel metallochaperone HypA [Candidatus Limnocylindria bacterium]
MHEAGITRRLLEVALERAAAAGADHITDVHVEIGEDSDVAQVAVEHYWPELTRGTLAEGSRLRFQPAADARAFRIIAIDVP